MGDDIISRRQRFSECYWRGHDDITRTFRSSDSTERWRAGPTPGEASEDFAWRRVVSLNGVDFHTDVVMLAALMSRRS